MTPEVVMALARAILCRELTSRTGFRRDLRGFDPTSAQVRDTAERILRAPVNRWEQETAKEMISYAWGAYHALAGLGWRPPA